MTAITDGLLDQLQDEMRDMAVGLRGEARVMVEDDDIRANKEIAELLEYVAGNRPLLVRFAFTLRLHSTRHGAIAALTGGAA